MSEISKSPNPPLLHRSEEEVNHFLRGFPEPAIASAQELRSSCNDSVLEDCLLGLLTFYVPKGTELPETGNLSDARLREDLGLDSLALSEAMFKVEDLFDIYIDNAEVANVSTLADARQLLMGKLAERDE